MPWLLLVVAWNLDSNVAGAYEEEVAATETSPDDGSSSEAPPTTDVSRAKPQTPKDEGAVRWQFGLAMSVLSYQRADFDVEPLASGQSLPGVLERTNRGPSGGSILIEPGYVLNGTLVLGMLLDIGFGRNDSEIKDLSFEISQSQASFAIGPRAAYYLAPSSRLRPFASLAAGYTFTPSKQAGQGLRLTMIQGFSGIGLAYFPIPYFSFETSLRAAYGIGSGYVDTGVLKNAALSGSIYTLMWTLGTSGWLP